MCNKELKTLIQKFSSDQGNDAQGEIELKFE